MTAPTDADREAAAAYLAALVPTMPLLAERVSEGQTALARAFAAHRLLGHQQGIEMAAKVAMHHANARRAAQDNAKKRKAKVEARDFESMAIEATQIECTIRNLAPEAEQ